MDNDDIIGKWLRERYSAEPRWVGSLPGFGASTGDVEVIWPGLQADPQDAHGRGSVAEKQPTPKPPAVTWDDIGGQEEAKRQMIEAIELPFTHKEIFAYYGKKPPKGIMLYGPPGCGKTMFGKAAATAIAKLHGRDIDEGGFIYVKAPEILDKYVGESEKKVRELFEEAREYYDEHGCPAVLFFDEADAIMMNRSRGPWHCASLVAAFLTEMDGLEDSGAIVILATNRPDSIDPAIVRDGRIDRKIRIDRPGAKESEIILRKNLQSVPLRGSTQAGLAKLMAREFFSPDRVLFNLHTESQVHRLTLAHVVNGAMLVGAVDQACSLALHRDLLTNKQTGLRKMDVVRAIDGIQRQQLDFDHSDTAHDLIEILGGKLIRAEKAKPENRPKATLEPSIDGPANIFEEVA